jgi:hypothetical protein
MKQIRNNVIRFPQIRHNMMVINNRNKNKLNDKSAPLTEKGLFWLETNKMAEKNVKFPHR